MKVRKIERKEIELPLLSEAIATAIKKSGLSVTQVCDAVGISRTYWYKVVNNKEEAIALETLRKIEQVLNVDLGVDL
ncbi:helix-turn-helix domain-containing protein [Nostoc sp.]|uniref:helix-turn-helix domain-containing protein n=1 Tax=Nostoc sp. TaxID=1180 RepID=UPI002FF85272